MLLSSLAFILRSVRISKLICLSSRKHLWASIQRIRNYKCETSCQFSSHGRLSFNILPWTQWVNDILPRFQVTYAIPHMLKPRYLSGYWQQLLIICVLFTSHSPHSIQQSVNVYKLHAICDTNLRTSPESSEHLAKHLILSCISSWAYQKWGICYMCLLHSTSNIAHNVFNPQSHLNYLMVQVPTAILFYRLLIYNLVFSSAGLVSQRYIRG
jgi:hypothetical protein